MKGNSKKTWEIINEISNNNIKRNIKHVPIKNKNGDIISDNKEKVNVINEFFTNIGPEMAQKIKKSNELPANFLNDISVAHTLFLEPVTDNEIINIISNLKNNCSPGPDGIKTELIKNIHKHISKPLVHIINLVYKNGNLPIQWKDSIITPIFKSGDVEQLTNYRPISVINISYKKKINFLL